MSCLSGKGVKPEMVFKCCDCGHEYTGQEVIDGSIRLTIVKVNKEDPVNSTFRCECCQDDVDEGRTD